MKTCTMTCDKCGKESGTLTPIHGYDIGISDGAFHTNWKFHVDKDLCGSCKHDLEGLIKGFFK